MCSLLVPPPLFAPRSLSPRYAYASIRSEITRSIQNADAIVRLPSSQHEKLSKLMGIQRSLLAQSGMEPSVDQLASAMRASTGEVERLFGLLNRQKHTNDIEELERLVAEGSAHKPPTQTYASRTELLSILGKYLRPQEIKALELRFGLDEDVPQQMGESAGRARVAKVKGMAKGNARSMREVSVIMECSKETIRLTVARALEKLRASDLRDQLGMT